MPNSFLQLWAQTEKKIPSLIIIKYIFLIGSVYKFTQLFLRIWLPTYEISLRFIQTIATLWGILLMFYEYKESTKQNK